MLSSAYSIIDKAAKKGIIKKIMLLVKSSFIKISKII